MFKENRKEKIIDLLGNKKMYKVDDLCKYFDVSLTTMHRDLNELKREGRIKKVHGGVFLSIVEDIETKNIIRLQTNVELKQKIAKKALELIENEDCIFLDNSTTCLHFAKELSESAFKSIIIITNSNLIPGLFIKNNNIEVVSTGGTLVKELNCFVGSNAINTINNFNGNKYFFSTAAISIEGGLSDMHTFSSNDIKKEMYKKSKECICLVDSSKFYRMGQCRVFTLEEVDKIITDNNCEKRIRENFARVGKELIIA